MCRDYGIGRDERCLYTKEDQMGVRPNMDILFDLEM
jgi:hypothetical protein